MSLPSGPPTHFDDDEPLNLSPAIEESLVDTLVTKCETLQARVSELEAMPEGWKVHSLKLDRYRRGLEDALAAICAGKPLAAEALITAALIEIEIPEDMVEPLPPQAAQILADNLEILS